MVSLRGWKEGGRLAGGNPISPKDNCGPETYGVRADKSKLVASVAPREIARSTTSTPTSLDQYHRRAGSLEIGSFVMFKQSSYYRLGSIASPCLLPPLPQFVQQVLTLDRN